MLVKLAALWMKQDKNGNTFMSGKLNDTCDVMIFTNKKTNEKQPDFILYFKPIEPPKTPRDIPLNAVTPQRSETQQQQGQLLNNNRGHETTRI